MKEIKDCKVIYGEHVSAQHNVLVLDWGCMRKELRIKWWRLKDDVLKKEFILKVIEGMRALMGVQKWWSWNSEVIRKAGEQLLGVTLGTGTPPDKEKWWWSEEEQEAVKAKKEAVCKRWETQRHKEDRENLREANKLAKKAVAKAKAVAMDDLYDK